MEIAVIGAAGKMGLWLARFLLEEGHEVLLIDKDGTRLAAARSQLKTRAARDIQAARDAEVILISVPIDRFEEAVKELSPHTHAGQVVMDVTSVKAMPVAVMHQYLKDCRILGAHPVFGPGATSLKSHNVVLTPISDEGKKLAEKVKGYLEARGAHVQLMTPHQHDEMMAVVLGLAHYIAIVAGDTLLGLDNLKDIELASGVTFRMLLTLVASVLGEDPALYASIQMHLPQLPKIQKEFLKKGREWAELVKQGDSQAFATRMADLRLRLDAIDPDICQSYQNMYHIAEGH